MKNNKKGFTLIELLVVIAIIGILAGVVMVNSKSAVDKAKRASALSTVSSTLAEIVTCADDGGDINAPTSTTGGVGSGNICSSGTTEWPDLTTTGWVYNVSDTANGNIADMTFTLTKTGETDITCDMAQNSCN